MGELVCENCIIIRNLSPHLTLVHNLRNHDAPILCTLTGDPPVRAATHAHTLRTFASSGKAREDLSQLRKSLIPQNRD
jgi:hypothetical protein